MLQLARRLLLLMAALAFLAGAPLALAVPPVLAAEPCPHEHQAIGGAAYHEHQHPQKQQHDHSAAGCLCCCIGACVGIPDLAHYSVTVAPLATAAVVYGDTADRLAGRSIRPEPAPPRTNALS